MSTSNKILHKVDDAVSVSRKSIKTKYIHTYYTHKHKHFSSRVNKLKQIANMAYFHFSGKGRCLKTVNVFISDNKSVNSTKTFLNTNGYGLLPGKIYKALNSILQYNSMAN